MKLFNYSIYKLIYYLIIQKQNRYLNLNISIEYQFKNIYLKISWYILFYINNLNITYYIIFNLQKKLIIWLFNIS